jgi:hypothetical protein
MVAALSHLIFSFSNSGVGRVVPGWCGRFALHLLVLTVSGSKVGLDLCPSFLSERLFIPPAAGAHEVPSCKYFGLANVDLL